MLIGQIACPFFCGLYILKPLHYIGNPIYQDTFNGRILIDDVGFFETGFSIYEVRAIRQFGVGAFLKAMPVEPSGKMTTTWGDIKIRSIR